MPLSNSRRELSEIDNLLPPHWFFRDSPLSVYVSENISYCIVPKCQSSQK